MVVCVGGSSSPGGVVVVPVLVLTFLFIYFKGRFEQTGEYPVFHNQIYDTVSSLKGTPFSRLVIITDGNPPSYISHAYLQDEKLYQYAFVVRVNTDDKVEVVGQTAAIPVITESGEAFTIYLSKDTQFHWLLEDILTLPRFMSGERFNYEYSDGNDWAFISGGHTLLRRGDYMNVFTRLPHPPSVALENPFVPAQILLDTPATSVFAFADGNDEFNFVRPFRLDLILDDKNI